MKKEDLIKLKKHIASFNDEEKKIRDLYLRKLATGELQGPPVGYPTIDSPHFKYLDESTIIDRANVVNAYKDVYDHNKNYMDQIALMFFGANITFR